MEQHNLTEQARIIGAGHGRNAASYVFDGNTSDETYRAFLARLDEGDPAVYDTYREPNLSGEFADEYSERDLAADLTSDECREQGHDATDHDEWDDAADTYQNAASSTFWFELERIAREHVDSAKIETLKSAGFQVKHAARPEDRDTVWCSDVQDIPSPGTEPYADLTRIGKGEDTADQSTTLDRSNFRAIQNDYPDQFTPLAYANVDALAAFVTDLPDELASILVKLADDYPVYSDDDLTELEDAEVSESWGQYVRCDITNELSEDGQEAWCALDEPQQASMFWQIVSDLDIYVEHDGHDVLWTRHYPAIAAELDKRLSQS